ITTSLLDIDHYKPVMLRLIFEYFRGVPVKFSATNRTKKVRLADEIDIVKLREELEHCRTLRYTESELAFIARNPSFNEPRFLEFLRNFQLPELLIEKDADSGQFVIEAARSWELASLWETIVLHTETELLSESRLKGLTEQEIAKIYNEGDARLSRKFKLLKPYEGRINIMEFATRRRWSKAWQRHEIERFVAELPGSLLGVSNMKHAYDLGIPSLGTIAHEMFMGVFGIMFDRSNSNCVLESQNKIMELSKKLFGDNFSTILTDTYGTDFFVKSLSLEQWLRWLAYRQDSGDPAECAEKIIAAIVRHGIDPLTKKIVFSDGLTAEKIIELYERFHGRIGVAFGWGTDLGNDLGFPTLSLVMKLVEANGNPTVKLSDNLAKAMGPLWLVEWATIACGYTNTRYEELVY
ncbi:hypothetical protein L0Y49_03765, partial [bacterium]|nr:hypothetical protein [bacterium]